MQQFLLKSNNLLYSIEEKRNLIILHIESHLDYSVLIVSHCNYQCKGRNSNIFWSCCIAEQLAKFFIW